MAKHPGGRPPKYENKEEIEELVEKYFSDCEGHHLLDSKGEAITDKYGIPIVIGAKPPTVTGLALALGFSGRKVLLDYQGKKEFCDAITRAKSRVEQYAEERLFDRDGVQGAKFNLVNNFSGWADRPAVPDSSAPNNNLLSAVAQSVKALEDADDDV